MRVHEDAIGLETESCPAVAYRNRTRDYIRDLATPLQVRRHSPQPTADRMLLELLCG